MGVEIAVFFARGAFGGSAHVTRLDLARSEESIASWTFLLGPADAFDLFVGIGFFSVGDGIGTMIVQTTFPEEEPMATSARMFERIGGSSSKVLALGLAAGGTFLTNARMVMVVVVMKSGFAFDAKMMRAKKSWKGIASVVVLSHFDENDLFGLGRTFEDDLVLLIHGQDYDLIVDEMTLKGVEFGQPARTFGNVSIAMECFGLSFLNGSSSS